MLGLNLNLEMWILGDPFLHPDLSIGMKDLGLKVELDPNEYLIPCLGDGVEQERKKQM